MGEAYGDHRVVDAFEPAASQDLLVVGMVSYQGSRHHVGTAEKPGAESDGLLRQVCRLENTVSLGLGTAVG